MTAGIDGTLDKLFEVAARATYGEGAKNLLRSVLAAAQRGVRLRHVLLAAG